jgi:predicted GNAT family N-acyltransferase
MAVLADWRGRGVGSAILMALLVEARNRGHATAQLHAQTHAIGFYARHGFFAFGPEFPEAGIPHRMMRLTLASRQDEG